MHEIPDWLLQLIAPAVTGCLAFLVKSYISQIKEALTGLKSSVDKVDGRIEAIQNQVHKVTVDSAVARKELQALWRAVDGSFKRASDANGEDS